MSISALIEGSFSPRSYIPIIFRLNLQHSLKACLLICRLSRSFLSRSGNSLPIGLSASLPVGAVPPVADPPPLAAVPVRAGGALAGEELLLRCGEGFGVEIRHRAAPPPPACGGMQASSCRNPHTQNHESAQATRNKWHLRLCNPRKPDTSRRS